METQCVEEAFHYVHEHEHSQSEADPHEVADPDLKRRVENKKFFTIKNLPNSPWASKPEMIVFSRNTAAS